MNWGLAEKFVREEVILYLYENRGEPVTPAQCVGQVRSQVAKWLPRPNHWRVAERLILRVIRVMINEETVVRSGHNRKGYQIRANERHYSIERHRALRAPRSMDDREIQAAISMGEIDS